MFETKTQEDIEVANEIVENLSQRFFDTINIRQILIAHNETGMTLISKNFVGQETDPDLISGFLNAISSFEKELVGLTGGLEELKYKYIRIMINIGKFITACLIVKGDYIPSASLRRHFKEFRERFELEFQIDLEKFNGLVKPFQNIDHLLEDHFEISLKESHILLPHKYYQDLIKMLDFSSDKLKQIRSGLKIKT